MLVSDFSSFQGEALGPPLRAAGFGGVIGQPLGNPKYAGQVASAQTAGLEVLAAYAFAEPGDGAALCDALLAALVGPELRVVIDCEVAGITPDQALAFGARARQWNPTVRPILYGSTSYIAANYGNTPTIAALFDAWIAEYHADLTPDNLPAPPPPFDAWIGWQYSSSYPVPGLGAVDASIFTGDGPTMLSDQDKAWMLTALGNVAKELVGDHPWGTTNVLGTWIGTARDQTITAVNAAAKPAMPITPAPAPIDVPALATALATELGPDLGHQLLDALTEQLTKT